MLGQTKKICKEYDIQPARSKGQNFLIKEGIYNKIIKSADLKSSDTVLEVGPGLGFLTEKLAKEVKQVIAVELDDKLAKILSLKLQEKKIKNVEIINKDILSGPTAPAGAVGPLKNYKIVANLPYNITSKFLRKFLEEVENKPTTMILMLQKEVAERIVAKPGDMSLLAVSVQFYAQPTIIGNVAKESFWPKPKVDSAIVKLEIRSDPSRLRLAEAEKFFKLVRAGFSAKRKQLKNNLVKNLEIKPEVIKEVLIKNNLNEKVRAQELSVQNWKNIFVVLDGQNML